MNFELYLDNNLIELKEDVSIPINKTYMNLTNPTNTLVDYSKSINIPITNHNNKILGNIYRLDRDIVSGSSNIGYHLDPSKKIPAKIIYNGEVLIDGYAKFISASNSTGNRYYTINLFGSLGDIFQKLRDVVASPTDLKEGQSNNYILADPTSGIKLDRNYVFDSFKNDRNSIGNDGIRNTDIVGFAPSHRGLYQEFSPNKIQSDAETIKEIKDYLIDRWTQEQVNSGVSEEQARANAEALYNDDLVGEGIPDYRMREYRSYMLKPYIYINQLFEMFKNNCRWLTGYEMKFDPTFFTVNNPYWSRMCYMLDFLENKGTDPENQLEFSSQTRVLSDSVVTSGTKHTVTYNFEKTIYQSQLSVSNGISISPFDIQLDGNYTQVSDKMASFGLSHTTNVIIEVSLTSGTNTVTKKYWTNASWGSLMPPDGLTAEDYLPVVSKNVGSMLNAVIGPNYNPKYTISIPQQTFSYPIKNAVTLNVKVTLENDNTGYDGSSVGCWSYTVWEPGGTYPNMVWWKEYLKTHTVGDSQFPLIVAKINYKTSWRDSTKIRIRDLYFGEKPIFDILLQYTKMFGLIWDVDYVEKTITIQTKNTYFKDYTITDWSKKLDRSKDFIIEPLTFGSKYINFNYDETDGYRYSGYKDKYNVEYGAKVLRTQYDFDNNSEDLFEGISPSSVSSKTYIPFTDIVNWRTGMVLIDRLDDKILIDSEETDEISPLSISNWYLRGANAVLDYNNIITDDTALMAANNDYCYIDPTYAINNGLAISTNIFPTFNVAIRDENLFYNDDIYGSLFTAPKEDYTVSKLPTAAVGNYIYDLFWDKYLNEVYNIKNKKVTCYMNLSASDFQTFKFNKFISLDNQVFLVNRIIDYNINSTGTTKVELLQVSDISAYGEDIDFPQVSYSPKVVQINGSGYQNDYGSFDVKIKSTPIVDSVMIQPYDSNSSDEAVTVSLTQNSIGGGDATAHIYFSGLGANKEKWFGNLRAYDKGGNVSVTIPVSIDFSNWSGTSTEPTKYTVTIVDALQCTLDCPSTVNEGETFVCTIIPKDSLGSIYVGGCEITMGGTSLEPANYINTTTKTLTIPNVTGNITLTISCTSVGDGSGGGNNSGPSIGDVVVRPGGGFGL